MDEPQRIVAPELKRMRLHLSRKRREPIRIIIATDPCRPVRTLTIPRCLPMILLTASALLVLFAIGLSFNTLSMRGTVNHLRNRVLSMVKLADTMAVDPLTVTRASFFAHGDGFKGESYVRKPSSMEGRFVLESVNTGESINVVLNMTTGELSADSYLALRRLMRCRRTGAEVPIDPRLIGLLFRFAQQTGQKIQLISGYRAPGFAAPMSYHIRGMAADIRIPGMTALMVRDLARAMGVRGIGYYPNSQFVHVDLREETFFWSDTGESESSNDPEMEGLGPPTSSEKPLTLDP
jgi:uncharacterized protein YcbK (DUF882 family)